MISKIFLVSISFRVLNMANVCVASKWFKLILNMVLLQQTNQKLLTLYTCFFNILYTSIQILIINQECKSLSMLHDGSSAEYDKELLFLHPTAGVALQQNFNNDDKDDQKLHCVLITKQLIKNIGDYSYIQATDQKYHHLAISQAIMTSREVQKDP